MSNSPPQSTAGPLQSDSACATAANSSNFSETNPNNVNDGSGWNYNNQIFTTPSYFYNNVGLSGLGSGTNYAGVDGNYTGSTQDIQRWAACKWGADEDWVYAQTSDERGWVQNCPQLFGGSGCPAGGDCNNPDNCGSPGIANLTQSFGGHSFPVTNGSAIFIGVDGLNGGGCPQNGSGAQLCPDGSNCWASWGIIQTKVNQCEWYTWPMVAISTAWGEDYRWAKFRSCVNGNFSMFGAIADYANAVSAARSNPNGLTTGNCNGVAPCTKPFSNETNLQYLALGCIATHFSGGWYDSLAQQYASDFVNSFLIPNNWPGGRP